MFGKTNQTRPYVAEIKQCPLFSDLSDKEIKKLIEVSHIRDYSDGEKIFSEGGLGICFYLILRGSVSVFTEKHNKPTEIKHLPQGSYFSEVHLFSESYHSVSCVSCEVTTLFVLSKPDLDELAKVEPRLALKIIRRFMEYFSEKLRELYKENRELKLGK